MKYDWLIVGAGYTGCVLAERIAKIKDQKVLIVDKRNHIGGNAFDYRNEFGVLVHKYGPHLFHTNSKKVWDYLSHFTKWEYYQHRVLAYIEGKKVPIPFNLNTIYELFSPNEALKYEQELIKEFGYGKKIPILELKKKKDNKRLVFLADYIYDNVFLGYTTKQWGLDPHELDGSVTARIPVYISRDDRYFQDKYQGVPIEGYTAMFKNILNHKNITVRLESDGLDLLEETDHEKLIFTGPVDQFFKYKHGKLPYRSLQFEHRSFDSFPWQECAQVNYPNNYDFTRITEFPHITGERNGKSTIAIEYSMEYEEGKNDPYYPIPNKETASQFEKYQKEIDKLEGKVIFAGRLADYKYYNMDQVVARALHVFEKKID